MNLCYEVFPDGCEVCTLFECICLNKGDCENCNLFQQYIGQCEYDELRNNNPIKE